MDEFFYGVIEGFYGRQWSWSARKTYAAFLKSYQFSCYIYAPKGDAFLRGRWQEAHPVALWKELLACREVYRSAGVKWGLGLSPLGLSECYDSQGRNQLLAKISTLNELQPDLLCILFDDSRADFPELAARQCELVSDVLSVSNAGAHIICPSYYSYDPVLEELFGVMPAGYFESLGRGLAPEVGVFWTGNRVISEGYSEDDFKSISAALQRKPVLWDNYPVNDGRLTSQYLHLKPFSGRPWQLSDYTSGHLVNPMNQAALSQLVLPSLSQIYQKKLSYSVAKAFQSACGALPPALTLMLNRDAEQFHEEGLAAFGEQERLVLSRAYQGIDHPVAKEIAGWLDGDYAFDPECLTG